MEFNNWKGRTYDAVIDDFAELLKTVKEVYSRDKDVDAEMMKKQNDLLHTLEFDDLNYHGIARLGKEIRELRRNRREYKNEYIFFDSIYKFLKEMDSDKFINRLTELADKLRKDAELIPNQKYTQRSNIKNITEIKKDSNKQDDLKSEDLISLNNILNRYCINLSSEFTDKKCENISIKMQLDPPMSLGKLKNFATNLKNNIESKYSPNNYKNISCKLITSDMILKDEFGKNILKCSIDIVDNETAKVIYSLNISLREGKNRDDDVKKSNKKKKRRKKH